VPFVEYSVGRREGKYQPQKVPQFTRSKAPFFDKILDKIAAEVENQIVKDIAKRIYDDLSTDQTLFEKLKTVATATLIHKDFYRNLKASMS
jgi:hypothetical protein